MNQKCIKCVYTSLTFLTRDYEYVLLQSKTKLSRGMLFGGRELTYHAESWVRFPSLGEVVEGMDKDRWGNGISTRKKKT